MFKYLLKPVLQTMNRKSYAKLLWVRSVLLSCCTVSWILRAFYCLVAGPSTAFIHTSNFHFILSRLLTNLMCFFYSVFPLPSDSSNRDLKTIYRTLLLKLKDFNWSRASRRYITVKHIKISRFICLKKGYRPKVFLVSYHRQKNCTTEITHIFSTVSQDTDSRIANQTTIRAVNSHKRSYFLVLWSPVTLPLFFQNGKSNSRRLRWRSRAT